MISCRNHSDQKLVEWLTFNASFTDWAPLYYHKSLCLTQTNENNQLLLHKDHVILVTKDLSVYFHFQSFSSSFGLNLSIIIVSPMYFALAIHYKVAYYAYIDFTLRFVSFQFFFSFLSSDDHSCSCCAYWPNMDIWKCLRKALPGTCCYNTSLFPSMWLLIPLEYSFKERASFILTTLLSCMFPIVISFLSHFNSLLGFFSHTNTVHADSLLWKQMWTSVSIYISTWTAP